MQNYCREYKSYEKNPFMLVPWSEDFLASIAELVQCFIEQKKWAIQDIVLVFPNIRPKRYLTARYKAYSLQKGKACLLPQMYTNTEFYDLCLHHFERGLPLVSQQKNLDRYAALFSSVKEVLAKKQYSHFSEGLVDTDSSNLQLAKFFPWASSLDGLFEECFAQFVLPQNIQYAHGEVSHFAQSLLQELEDIFSVYVDSMQKNMQITEAFNLFRTASYVRAYMQYKNSEPMDLRYLPFLKDKDLDVYFTDFMPSLLQGKLVIFAGFVQCSGAENIILKYFWEQGACISLYSDPLLAVNGKHVHYSCIDHKKWLDQWQAELYALQVPQPHKTEFSFLPAYDVHSQLEVLKQDIMPCLNNMQETDDYCAVVLPSASLLMPVLHELPNKNINISLGYPISRTLLWQFIQLIFTAQRNKRVQVQEGVEGEFFEYRAKDILALLQHPYTKMLLGNRENSLESTEVLLDNFVSWKEEFSTWRKVLFYAQKQLKTCTMYVSLADFLNDSIFDLDNKELPYVLNASMEQFVEDFFSLTVFLWEKTVTLRKLGENLNTLVEFMVHAGADVWKRFPLDKEAVARFLQNTIPDLMQSSIADFELGQSVLFSLVEELIAIERVPFEADPLTGLQVLGLLETRLLRFKNVYILDCTENSLPGMRSQDPLMPDSLRSILGLPDRQSRDRIVAHMFYRLIHSAEHVFFYWQEGILASEMQSTKNVRSRFIEELIWEKEKEYGGEKVACEQILRKMLCNPASPERRKKNGIKITPVIFSALANCLEFGLSASGLNCFLQCPVKFYYQYLAKIKDQSMQEEGNNYLEFGTRIHSVLKEQYTGQKKISFTPHTVSLLMDKFYAQFTPENWQDCFAPDSYFMAQESGPYFLQKFLEEDSEKDICLLTLEHELSHHISHSDFSTTIKLQGYADRIDRRGDSYWVVDYKTSKINKKQMKIWKNKIFFEELKNLNLHWNSRLAQEYFEVVAEQIPDIQLPYYLYLYAEELKRNGEKVDENTKINASWIFLGERKKAGELALVDEKFAKGKKGEPDRDMWEIATDIREKYMPILLDFLFNYMAKEKNWKCRDNKYCGDCLYREYC